MKGARKKTEDRGGRGGGAMSIRKGSVRHFVLTLGVSPLLDPSRESRWRGGDGNGGMDLIFGMRQEVNA